MSTSASYSRYRKDEILRQNTGRAPWYGLDGVPIDAYVIGIAGGSASGKTYVAQAILEHLGNIPTVLILSQDSFYKYHTQEELDLAFKSDLDLDCPEAIDVDLFAKCLKDLKKGRATEIPVYSFVTHQRSSETKYLYGASVIIVEGIMALNSPELRSLYDLKVFVNADSDLMLARRVRRDISERGRTVDGVIDQYLRFVKSSYDNYVWPSAKFADLIVPGFSNQVAVDLLVTHVRRQLDARSLRFRNKLLNQKPEIGKVLENENSQPSNLILLPQTSQLQGILTILRNQDTQRSDFIFYADRLSSMVVEKALSILNYKEETVTTPLGTSYRGQAIAAKDIVGVSVLRSGGPFVKGLRRVIRDVQIGSLLIQSDPKTGEPLLFHTSFPENIKNSLKSVDTVVFLLDSQVGTGAAALMAIRVMLDHGIQESNIIFLTMLVARQGLQTVQRAFPGVRIVTAAMDSGVKEMRFPVWENTVDGEGAGDADFATMVVPALESVRLNPVANPELMVLGDMEDSQDFSETDKLKFSRGHHTPEARKQEKRAWAITPGMGHIGDRYYLK